MGVDNFSSHSFQRTFFKNIWAKLQNTAPLTFISMNHKSAYCVVLKNVLQKILTHVKQVQDLTTGARWPKVAEVFCYCCQRLTCIATECNHILSVDWVRLDSMETGCFASSLFSRRLFRPNSKSFRPNSESFCQKRKSHFALTLKSFCLT